MKPLCLLLLLVAIGLSIQCHDPSSKSISFYSTLGKDTLGIEQFWIGPNEIRAEVLLRSPKTQLSEQLLSFNEDGSFKSFSSRTFDADNLTSPPVLIENAEVSGDSIRFTSIRDTSEQSIMVLYDKDLLPWIDMVHWPYEIASRRMMRRQMNAVDQPMLTGRNVAQFEFRTITPDSLHIKHPFRGTMSAKINAAGELLVYDATATTRKLLVSRGGPIDLKSFAVKYAGKDIGNLSGEGHTRAEVHGAEIDLTFGQPARRGRELFGNIVPWNERWRTGANRATHFKTSTDLRFGTLEVPAGEYTLFTIPQPEGGILIINRQTGQNGNTYDVEQDLGRVPMVRREQDISEERFIIEAMEQNQHGVLQLKWGQTVFEIPFEVTGAQE